MIYVVTACAASITQEAAHTASATLSMRVLYVVGDELRMRGGRVLATGETPGRLARYVSATSHGESWEPAR